MQLRRILFLVAAPLLIALPTLAHASEEIPLTARRTPLVELLLPPPVAPAPVREMEPVEVRPEAPQQPEEAPPAQSWAAAMRAFAHR